MRVRVAAPDAALRASMHTALGRAGVPLVREPSSDAVLLAAASTVDEALADCQGGNQGGIVVVADRLASEGVRRAVRAGVAVLVQSARATPTRLAAAVRSAHDGEGRLPHETLVRLLGTDRRKQAAPPRLTARQLVMLRLMAEGLDNIGIARALSCSAHTVKNVIYDLMSRLQARNRAHAVAAGVRAGLI
ncbi:response regulator transcription factor [Amycolatopsis sp., V23-08]|uniref:Response regulator transcription factor n=1 Tax=Amycolatopsis heterodermiae TaxID=3110235 RepID=A0ABU5R452_9PSEU|nr:response regulator transcription factor [Amycolatopsis sp., V23-08]MEA5360459.1 response regulator transcription factor [Amycolatopsis sp., V23-08]